jgi:DNA repair photolyase
VVRLPWEVAPLFRQWLQDHRPLQAERIMSRIQDMRGGRDYDPRFGARMKGQGVWADLIRQRVQRARAAHGLSGQGPALDTGLFTAHPGQGSLF